MHSLLIGHLFITFFLILQATHILSMQRWIAAAFLKYFEQKWFRNEETSIKGRRESNTGRELGQGVSAGTRTSDIWQQASSSATCPWVMNTQVNEIDGGTRKHAVKQGKKWQRWVPPGKWNADEIAGFQFCSFWCFFFFFNLASINVMSRNLWHSLSTDSFIRHTDASRVHSCFLHTVWLWLQCKMENVRPLCCHKHALRPGGGALSGCWRDW